MINFMRDTTKIKKVLSLKIEEQENKMLIIAECSTNYSNEEFTIAKIFKDWKEQGNYTYFKGSDSEKEYKTVKPILNAIDRWVESINGDNDIWYYDKEQVLLFTGLKNKNENIKKYNKYIKTKQEQEERKEIKEIDNLVINLDVLNNTKLESEKEQIKQYCIDEYKKEYEEAKKVENTINSIDYVKTPLYHFASNFISMLSWNYYHGKEYDSKYKGRHLHCKDCKHCTLNNNNDKYNCSNLNSNILISCKNEICSKFTDKIEVKFDSNKYKTLEQYLTLTNKLKNITFEEWKREKMEYCNFNDYIHYLNNCEYIDYKGDSTLKYKSNTLYINDKILYIPINEKWFDLNLNNNIFCKKIAIKSKKRNKTEDVININSVFKTI
ncbi:UNVERIFIED_ORG: hypothetical protein B2H93_04880 [Clostridium botulinum]